jgi:hypothetical protein
LLGFGLVFGLITGGCGSDAGSLGGSGGTGDSSFVPLESFFEEDAEGPYVSCTPADFDAGACEAAVNP